MWSILARMAKVQRWRRRSSAGEGEGATSVALHEHEPDSGEPSRRARRRSPVRRRARTERRLSLRWVRESLPVQFFVAAHPKQAVVTALALGGVAALAGRPTREVGVVLATVLVGQTILGWHNDVVDRHRDASHETPRKPIAEGRLDADPVWYAIVLALLLLVPLSISTGVTAGINYLISIAIGLVANVALRRGIWSWVPWALSFALYPAYLSYGGWGGAAEGSGPEPLMTLLAALLGIGVHFLRSIWGLVADNADGWTYLPLRLGLRLGATRLLVVVSVYIAVIVALMAVFGSTVGLSR